MTLRGFCFFWSLCMFWCKPLSKSEMYLGFGYQLMPVGLTAEPLTLYGCYMIRYQYLYFQHYQQHFSKSGQVCSTFSFSLTLSLLNILSAVSRDVLEHPPNSETLKGMVKCTFYLKRVRTTI